MAVSAMVAMFYFERRYPGRDARATLDKKDTYTPCGLHHNNIGAYRGRSIFVETCSEHHHRPNMDLMESKNPACA
jgi:hypothetical protein